jgi:hypothetical protein
LEDGYHYNAHFLNIDIEFYLKGLGLKVLTWICMWCTKSFCKNLELMAFKIQLMDCKFGFYFLMDFDMVHYVVHVRDLVLVRYHIKEAKKGKKLWYQW